MFARMVIFLVFWGVVLTRWALAVRALGPLLLRLPLRRQDWGIGAAIFLLSCARLAETLPGAREDPLTAAQAGIYSAFWIAFFLFMVLRGCGLRAKGLQTADGRAYAWADMDWYEVADAGLRLRLLHNGAFGGYFTVSRPDLAEKAGRILAEKGVQQRPEDEATAPQPD